MTRLTAWLKSDRGILRSALVLGGGTAVGQGIMIAATPLISRLYTPENIGQFALYLSFIGVAVTIAPLGYQRAIPQTSTKQEAAHLATGILLVQPLMCLLLVMGQWFLMSRNIAGFGDLPVYTVFLTGFTILANSLLFTLQFWFIRAESYSIISRVQIFQNIGRATCQVGLGIAGSGLFGLIAGDFSGRLLGLAGMVRNAWSDLAGTFRPYRPELFRAAFTKYRKFLFPQLPSIVINTTARMLPIPLMVHFYGADGAGLYAMVDRVMQVPLAFVSKSFGNALHGRVGNLSRNDPGRIMGVFMRTAGGLFLAGIAPAVAILLWGDTIFVFVLGEQWHQAGLIAARIAPLALLSLVVSTSSSVVYIFQAFYTELLYNITSLAFVIGVFMVGARREWELLTTVSWLAGFGIVAYALYFVLLVLIIRRGVPSLIAELGSVDESGTF